MIEVLLVMQELAVTQVIVHHEKLVCVPGDTCGQHLTLTPTLLHIS